MDTVEDRADSRAVKMMVATKNLLSELILAAFAARRKYGF
jgi:hypothetical protein